MDPARVFGTRLAASGRWQQSVGPHALARNLGGYRTCSRSRPSSSPVGGAPPEKNRGEWLMRSIVARWACAVLLAVAAGAALASPPDQPYTVKPGDQLVISVWKEPELQHKVLVEPDGTFSFPLCGQIDAHDKTVAQLQGEIT